MTQIEFAEVLGVSARAVQSYEQGWRVIPPSTLLHLFALLASVRRKDVGDVPCWVLTGCPESKRGACRSHRLNGGLFCWLVAGHACGRNGDTTRKSLRCIGCPVIQRLISS